MEAKEVRNYFDSEAVVDHYAAAVQRVGLWLSEEKIFTKLFDREASLLELGCGTGRIAFGLYDLGYKYVLASDFSKPMIRRAKRIAEVREYRVSLRVCDATDLEFEDNVFDGAIFGFNGLMQIPGAIRRQQALKEIYRVIRPGAWFVFTSHDRERSRHRSFWEAEALRYTEGKRRPGWHETGDRSERTDSGLHFMHVPTIIEMEARLAEVGFRIEAHAMRSVLANESQAVREFSDDCRFWIVQKPESEDFSK